ncbi:hypothetical protein DAEQUDRAFT_251226 [Daedalea quercina L-15889]|uniref:Uncharacterized protein n=1 Tax=Daedalea quercina L-15889 TaxID=1314783 RepID=A0A165QNT1_9APHY|nr:hypothetical protein DAEQUDRAFT_251226 [Daedalea quercina L-15889]
MRAAYLTLVVAFFVTNVAAASVALRRHGPSFNPTNVHLRRLLQHPPHALTNAQRVSRGLAPARPILRSDKRLARRAGPSQTPTSSSDTTTVAPTTSSSSSSSGSSTTTPGLSSSSGTTTTTSTDTSPTTTSTTPTATCTAHVGTLKLTSVDDTESTFWVNSQATPFGEYGYTTEQSEALQVQYTLCDSDSSTGPFNLLAINGLTTYPYVGAIIGFADTSDNLASSSYNYLYIGGTHKSDPGALPQSGATAFSAASGTQKDYESSIWLIDPTTSEVTAQWINTDGSKPTVYLIYVPSSGALALTGNVNDFTSHFGGATEVTLMFEEASTSLVAATAAATVTPI